MNASQERGVLEFILTTGKRKILFEVSSKMINFPFTPRFPNLPVVVKPEYPFRVTRGVRTPIYVRVPLWVGIYLGKTAIIEIPIWGNETRVSYGGAEEGSKIEVSQKAPSETPEAKQIASSRDSATKRFTASMKKLKNALTGKALRFLSRTLVSTPDRKQSRCRLRLSGNRN
jgi:hypothetical protein